MQLTWSTVAWTDYVAWQQEDKKTLKRINALIKETIRTPFEGTGKPEPLRGDLSGCWSRRIDEKNRLVYRVTPERLEICSCKSHYEKL